MTERGDCFPLDNGMADGTLFVPAAACRAGCLRIGYPLSRRVSKHIYVIVFIRIAASANV